MNTYRIGGKYNLWSSEELPRETFSCIVLAQNTEEAIQICKANYREAEITATLIRDEGVLAVKGVIDWNNLQSVYEKSKLAAVSFVLNYEESTDQWYFYIESASKAENFIGNPSSFDGAVSAVIEWLDKLIVKGEDK